MKKLGYGLVIVLSILSVSVSAQKGKAEMKFKEETFDFGTIKESDGKVSHVFEFTNTSAIPVIISDVKPACDCTTPEWSRQPVLPGKKGMIKATYDPKDRGGYFQKEINVFSNASNSNLVLKITGMVVQKNPIVEQKYTFKLGDIRLTKSYISFDTVYNTNQKKIEKVEVINTGKTPAELQFTKMPSYIKIIPSQVQLKAGETGVFIIIIDGSAVNDWGFIFGYPIFNINKVSNDKFKLTVSANLIENFNKLTVDEKANAPIAVNEKPVYNFGTVKEGEKVEHDFEIKNNGKRDLIFRKINTTCGCTTFVPSNDIIKAGESGTIKVTFDTQNRKGEQTKTLTIITNVPSQPTFTITLKGIVE